LVFYDFRTWIDPRIVNSRSTGHQFENSFTGTAHLQGLMKVKFNRLIEAMVQIISLRVAKANTP